MEKRIINPRVYQDICDFMPINEMNNQQQMPLNPEQEKGQAGSGHKSVYVTQAPENLKKKLYESANPYHDISGL